MVDLLIQHKQETNQDLISCITIIIIQCPNPTKEEVEEEACPQQLAEDMEEISLMKIRNQQKIKKAEMKFAPYGSWNGKTSVTCDTVKDHLLQFIQKTYKNGEDVVTSLRNGEIVNLEDKEPQLGVSEETNEAKRAILQKGLEIRYQTDYTRYCDRVDMLKQNLIRAYALILSIYCTKVMQSRVKQHADFETDIMNDPIKLLEVIKVLLHDTVRGKYPYASVTDSIKHFLIIMQK